MDNIEYVTLAELRAAAKLAGHVSTATRACPQDALSDDLGPPSDVESFDTTSDDVDQRTPFTH